MASKNDVAALQGALPAGAELTHVFRAEPPYRKALFWALFVGVVWTMLFRIGPRRYLVGLTEGAILLLPLPRRKDTAVTTLQMADLTRIAVTRGFLGRNIAIDTRQAQYRMRVPGLQARGAVSAALTALAELGAAVEAAKADAPVVKAAEAASAQVEALPSSMQAPAAPAAVAVQPAAAAAPASTTPPTGAPLPQQPLAPFQPRPTPGAAAPPATGSSEAPALHAPAAYSPPPAQAGAAAGRAAVPQPAPYCDRCGRPFAADEDVCPRDGRPRRLLQI